MKSFVFAFALAAVLSSGAASAQSFPNKTVRVMVPTAPGGGIDVSCRIVTAKLQKYWGHPVVVENRPGAASLLALELFNALAGTQITPISYKGAGPALASLMAGETQIAFADIGSGASTLKSGRVRVLGIATLERSKLYPDWPTIDESGVPKFETSTWVAMFAPAATPREITERIGHDVRRALADPDVRQRFQAINFEVVGSTAEGLASIMRRDTDKWRRLVRERNLKFSQ
ncbi:MAG: Bug family tripartite tricarboxylate transporter substrate binding protein [Burkholderiales bacterium]